MTAHSPIKPEFALIPLELIDEPELAMRETMSDDGLSSLAESIRSHGLLHPIGVVQAGSRFRVVYGHRRRMALPRAGRTHAEAYVYPEGTTTEEAMKVAENTEREDVNPAAEATYYLHLYEKRCDHDIDKVARLVGKTRSYVDTRLALTEGDPEVLAALRADDISISIAQALNKVKHEGWRRQWLHDARTMGLSSRQINVLRGNLEREQAISAANQGGEQPAVPPSTVAPVFQLDRCMICRSARDQTQMTYVKVHGDCLSAYERSLDDGGEPGADRA